MPQIENELLLACEKVEKELAALPVLVHKDASATVTALVFKFCQELSRRIEGTAQLPDSQLGLMQSVHQVHLKFKTDIRNTAPKFCPWEKPDEDGRDCEVGSIQGSYLNERIASPALSQPAQPPAHWFEDPSFLETEDRSGDFCDRVGRIFYLDEVMRAAEECVFRT